MYALLLCIKVAAIVTTYVYILEYILQKIDQLGILYLPHIIVFIIYSQFAKQADWS